MGTMISQWLVILLFFIIPLFIFFKNLIKNLSDRSVNRFDQDSRLSRSEHGNRFLIFVITNAFISLLVHKSEGGASFLFVLISIGLLVFYFNIAVKRLHDLNMSGWHSLILIIPLVNLVVLLCLFFVKGSHSLLDPKHFVPENLKDDV